MKIFSIFLCTYQKKLYLCTAFQNDEGFRAFSSAGSEHLPYKQRVGGSNPSTPTKPRNFIGQKASRSHDFGRLAQLVQSICLTSRGSAVRIRQRPHTEVHFTVDFFRIYPLLIVLRMNNSKIFYSLYLFNSFLVCRASTDISKLEYLHSSTVVLP